MQQIVVDFGTLEFLGLELPLRIFGYGLALVLGFLAGIFLAQVRARRAGENPEHVAYCGMLALVGGIVGARLAWVLEQFIKQPHNAPRTFGEIINITSGGLIYYGGLVLATIAVLAFLKIKRLPTQSFMDIMAPSQMIGLTFGRFGCLLNGCCYGAPCRSDWHFAMRFPMYTKPLVKLDGRDSPYSRATEGPSPAYASQLASGVITPDSRLTDEHDNLIQPAKLNGEQIRIAEGAYSRPVKPAQFLGIINGLVLAALLLAFDRLKSREGQGLALLVILYPVTRFMLELVRADNSHNLAGGILTHNQWTSILLMLGGIVFWIALYAMPASAGPTAAQRSAASGNHRRAPQSGRKRKTR
ncbi:MAG: prolipoprotein diacylglyceryl transferase [Planctomycetota bacterium]|jgi:phosphatidylglycerol:prolipoprotein diacylglycerol transferase